VEIFGFSAAKIVVILTIAIVLFGPDKVPEMAAQVGRLIRDFRRYTREMTQEFSEATGGLRDEFATLAQDLRGELTEAQADLRRQLDLTGVFGETGAVTAGMPEGAGAVGSKSSITAVRAAAGHPQMPQAMPAGAAAADTALASDPSEVDAPMSDRRTPHATRTDPLADLALLVHSPATRGPTSRVVGRSVGASRYLRRASTHAPRQPPPMTAARIRREDRENLHRPLAAD
jgi:sec-independent protein translocase protein TatB